MELTTRRRANARNVTIPRAQLRRLRLQLSAARHEARTDPLTGLANRAGLLDRMQTLPASGGVVVLLDLDRFKPINDTMGHEVGDQVLITTAQRLRAVCGTAGIAGRLGGDEFVLLLDHTGPDAVALVQACVQAVCQPQTHHGVELTVGTSAGLAPYEPGLTPADLLRRADLSLYAAKRDRGTVVQWNPALAAPDVPGDRARDWH